MGSLDARLSRLEGCIPDILAERDYDEQLTLQRAITRMILDEFARLKANGETGDLLSEAVRCVVEDQCEDLSPESRQYIAEGWIETIHSWTRLDWMVSAGREGPPHA